MIHIGFTGTQVGMSDHQRAKVKTALLMWLELDYVTFHHGDCIGADAQAHDIAVEVGCSIVIHPPSNPNKRAWKPGFLLPAKPYLERNHDIVDMSRSLIATPKGEQEELRSGTWATVRYARRKHCSVEMIYP